MRYRAVGISLACALLVGCGGSSPLSVAPSAGQGRLTTTTSSKPIIYVADQFDSQILTYSERTGQQIGEITDGVNSPYGLFVDANGTLYVANEGANTVTAYPAGSTTPSMTWSQDLNRPHYPIVDANGDLFVSNEGDGTVVEFKVTSTSAHQVLQTAGSQTDGMDFDTAGNLYVAFRRGDARHQGGIEEYAPGSSTGRVLRMALNEPQGLIVDGRGTIVVVVTGSADRVELYRNSDSRWAFLKLPCPMGTTFTQLALKAKETKLFASSLSGAVYTMPYPPAASKEWTQLLDANSIVQGIALSNGQTF